MMGASGTPCSAKKGDGYNYREFEYQVPAIRRREYLAHSGARSYALCTKSLNAVPPLASVYFVLASTIKPAILICFLGR